MIHTTWLYCAEVATPQGDVTGIDFGVAPPAGEMNKARSRETPAIPLINLRSVTEPFLLGTIEYWTRECAMNRRVRCGSCGISTQAQAFPYSAWLLVNGPVPRSIKTTPTWNDVLVTQRNIFRCTSGYPNRTIAEQATAETACDKKLDVENASVFIADDQFWSVQLREGLLYLVAGAALVGGALVLVRRIEP